MLRFLSNVVFQGNLRAPPVELQGKRVVLTGPTKGGIGFETALALCKWGAHVTLCARNAARAEDAVDTIKEECKQGIVEWKLCDLSMLEQVDQFCSDVERDLQGTQLDILICNAGKVLPAYECDDQGLELTFKSTVLAHLLMVHKLRPKRTVWLTGDIYVLSKGDPDPYLKHSGEEAYNRACLARLLLTRQLKAESVARNDKREFVAVHPGVIATGLMNPSAAVRALMKLLFLKPEQGAQAVILAATMPSQQLHQHEALPYYHYKFGWMKLADSDKANSSELAKRLLVQCNELCEINR